MNEIAESDRRYRSEDQIDQIYPTDRLESLYLTRHGVTITKLYQLSSPIALRSIVSAPIMRSGTHTFLSPSLSSRHAIM